MARPCVLPDGAMTRVLLVDDQAVVRTGLRTVLEQYDDIEVVGEAADGQQGVALTRQLHPDVVLMDIRMPVLDGIAATRELTSTGDLARVVVLTTYGMDEHLYQALKAGATGFLVKTEDPAHFVEAVRTAAKGDALLGPATTRRLVERFLTGPAPDATAPAELGTLTEREKEVLLLVAAGHSNAEIANRLFLGEGTVKTHVARILAKLGLRDRVQAVVYAYEHRVITPGQGPTA
jgi:DNA-binding NarL/FixJ family response regulator